MLLRTTKTPVDQNIECCTGGDKRSWFQAYLNTTTELTAFLLSQAVAALNLLPVLFQA